MILQVRFLLKKNSLDEIRGWLSGVKILGSLNSDDVFSIIDCISNNKLDGFIFNENQINFVEDLTLDIKVLEIDSARLTENLVLNWSIFNLIVIKGDISPEINIKIKSSFDGEILLGYDFVRSAKGN